MEMDKLWAPWRVKYVTEMIGKRKGCIFCEMPRARKDPKNFILTRTRHSYSVLNIYPYNNGHVLLVPNRHVNDFSKLKKEEKMDLLELLESTQSVLDKILKPGGYNVGVNIGRVAGAGFPGHLHIHVVPRWKGDVNFMPVIGSTKVISQSLKVLYKLIAAQYSKRK